VLLHVMSTFPPLSETFVMREIRQLQRSGWDVRIGQLRPLYRTPQATGFEDLRAAVSGASWLDSDMLVGLVFFSFRYPLRLSRCFGLICCSLSRPRDVGKMLYILLASLRLAYRFQGSEIDLIRAHFLHSEALAARFLSMLLEAPYSLTVYTTFALYRRSIIEEIVRGADFLVADTAQAKEFLQSLGGRAERIEIVYNSIRVEEFPRQVRRNSVHLPVVLGVGRLDPKKGYHVLLHACALLRRRGVRFQTVLIGEGTEKDRLMGLRRQLGLEGQVELLGKLPFEEVKPWYYRADVFVMPSVVTPQGDTDGLPTVVIEAMAASLPVVGTSTGGIPEAVREGITGFIVPANSPEALADRIQQLLEREDLRIQFGMEGRRVVERQFDLKCKADALTRLIGQFTGSSPAAMALGKPPTHRIESATESSNRELR